MSCLPILVVNPNVYETLTLGIERALGGLVVTGCFPPPTCFTAPPGSPLIIVDADCALSAAALMPHLTRADADALSLVDAHAAVLVACYSSHPLVPQLEAYFDKQLGVPRPVIGIFEASITAALALLRSPGDQFGIVTTAVGWVEPLARGVNSFLGFEPNISATRFAGVESTGLEPIELHIKPPAEVEQAMKDAVARLLRRSSGGSTQASRVRAICLGCAGMAGMEDTVRISCIEVLGASEGGKVQIVDGVRAGYAYLEGLVRSRV